MTIVFIHGAWMTSQCWDKFIPYFESKGYTCIAPSWPYKTSVEEMKQAPNQKLKRLSISEIVDYYEKIITELPEPPILIGHSFGGLFVQMLLDRGLGKVGVALNSAPPKGVFAFYPSALKSNFGVLATPLFWRKIVHMSCSGFNYAFVNTLTPENQQAAYDKYVVPESGKVFFEAATSMFNNKTYVNFKNNNRAPLLMISGNADHICVVNQVESNFKKYAQSSAKTEYKMFEGRSHWIIAQPGWEEVAEFVTQWVEKN